MMNLKRHIQAFLGIGVLLFGITSCGGTKGEGTYPFEENPPFTLGEVSYQEWVAGVQGGGSGVNVFIPVEEFKAEVTFKNIYFREQVVDVQTAPNNPDLFTGYFLTKRNRDVIMDGDPLKEAKNTPPASFPFELAKNEAVLSYELGGEIFYLLLLEMTEKPMLAYPEGNPGID